MIQTTKYEPHDLAKIIPPMTSGEFQDLVDNIRKNGLLQGIVLYEGKVLDGVHRQKACALAGVEPRYMQFEQLPKVVQDAGPVAMVAANNLHRRHLSPTQRAAAAADLVPHFAAEAEKRKMAGLKQGDELPSVPRGSNGEVTGRATEQAAKVTGASPRSVARAVALKKKNPKKFAEAKAGKTTLGAALRDKKAEAKAAAAAKKAARGLDTDDTLANLFVKASSAGGKLTVVIGWWKLVVTKLKEPKAKAKAKGKVGRPRKTEPAKKRGRPKSKK